MNDAEMIAALGSRVAIIGNSGSGKTTLARRLGERAEIPVTDLDRIHWQGEVLQARDQQVALTMVRELADEPRWIIEGVYGWLVAAALPRATALIWLDLPWAVCRAGLQARGPWPGATEIQHAEFLEWAADYWRRENANSFAGHLLLFERFDGPKCRLRSHSEIDTLVANTSAPLQ